MLAIRGHFRVAVASVVACLFAVALGQSSARAEAKTTFPRPESLEPQINFWVDVFTAYSYRDFVITDRDDAYKIYQVYHLPGDGCPSRDEIDWANKYLKKKYGDILERLAAGHEPQGTDERHVAEMFEGRSPYALRLAADNLRVQEGLKERFREGLLRSKYYRPTMEKIFQRAGLPVELITLAQVESGFQRGAHSSAGALGIWQFTRSTGRQYSLVRGRHDDRMNPTRETEAAAKLLGANYETLGDWPLAITAYNYGTGGTARAAEASGSDYSTMLRTYNGPHFGFAVKNYYAEFLAALQVHQYEAKYFPGIQYEAPMVPAPLPIQTAHQTAHLIKVSSHPKHHSKHRGLHAHSRHHHSVQAT
ncbi:MAG TPA: lytic transglycosylase domain-containing protein [Candidatus Binataceae bacterium]|nr:lytic transglycosylase domain-containing protein [Candidatus Binataceae bacterium]